MLVFTEYSSLLVLVAPPAAANKVLSIRYGGVLWDINWVNKCRADGNAAPS